MAVNFAKASGWIPDGDITTRGDSYNGSAPADRSVHLSKFKHVRSASDTVRLPPAVANVPPDDIRGYVHAKRINDYLVGSTLGEGSFAKVREAFHVLVGEKVSKVGLGHGVGKINSAR